MNPSSKPRKNMPGYTPGVDSLNRKTWNKVSSYGRNVPRPPAPEEENFVSIGGCKFPLHHHDMWNDPEAVNLQGANLSGLFIQKVGFYNSTLNCVDLRNANFWMTNFHQSSITQASSREATYESCSFKNTTVHDSDFRYSFNQELTIRHTDFKNSKFEQAEFLNTSFRDALFSRCSLDSVTFEDSLLEDTLFRSSQLPGSVFTGSTLLNCSFENTSLKGTKFVDSHLAGDFNLKNCDVEGVDFKDTHLRIGTNVYLHGSNITQQQVKDLLEDYINPGGFVFYDQFTLSDLSKAVNIPPDELILNVWSGDIEIRENETKKIVTGAYDKNKHHVPQWIMPR